MGAIKLSLTYSVNHVDYVKAHCANDVVNVNPFLDVVVNIKPVFLKNHYLKVRFSFGVPLCNYKIKL